MDPLALYYVLVCTVTIPTVLPYCYFATQITFELRINSEQIYHSLWYKLPVKQQYDMQFLLQYSQFERKIMGFNFVECSMPSFLKVNSIYFC